MDRFTIEPEWTPETAEELARQLAQVRMDVISTEYERDLLAIDLRHEQRARAIDNEFRPKIAFIGGVLATLCMVSVMCLIAAIVLSLTSQ